MRVKAWLLCKWILCLVMLKSCFAIVPDRVDREVGACHYAVLHLCFGSGNKQAFARYFDSLEGQLCLAVAQNLADLLWALGGFESLPERRPVVQRFPCPRQNAPNCALHAALICRALYLHTNISVVTPAAVAHFRKSLGELLQQCRHEFPSFLQLGDYRGLNLVNAIFEALPTA